MRGLAFGSEGSSRGNPGHDKKALVGAELDLVSAHRDHGIRKQARE
jgi:hypothetical protein